MIFSAPADALGDLVDGLAAIAASGGGLPSDMSFQIEYSLEKSYVEIGREIGMGWVR